MVRWLRKRPGTALVLALLFAGLASGVAATRWNRYHLPFESSAWQAAPRGSLDDTRHRMLRSLLREHPLQGMTRDQLIALLGPGSDTPLFGDYDVRYELGSEFGQISLDRLWLVIRCDDAGRVREYRLLKE
jgi:hypothetical protein